MTVLTCLLFPTAGACVKQVMAHLLNLPGQLAYVRRASFLGETKVCPGGCPGRGAGWIPGASHLLVDPTPLNWHHPLLKQFISAPLMPSEALQNVIIHRTTILLFASEVLLGTSLLLCWERKIH